MRHDGRRRRERARGRAREILFHAAAAAAAAACVGSVAAATENEAGDPPSRFYLGLRVYVCVRVGRSAAVVEQQ